MQNRMIWFDREFKFEFSVDIFPMVVERLRGTPIRLEEKLARLNNSILTARPMEGWSVLEQVGHLVIIEALWIGRLDDFLGGKETLRPADENNSLTKQTDHHARSIDDTLAEFRKMRTGLVDRLYDLTTQQAGMVALHPRLGQPMRLIDTFCFAAEHDDHHLSRMTDLIASRR